MSKINRNKCYFRNEKYRLMNGLNTIYLYELDASTLRPNICKPCCQLNVYVIGVLTIVYVCVILVVL